MVSLESLNFPAPLNTEGKKNTQESVISLGILQTQKFQFHLN